VYVELKNILYWADQSSQGRIKALLDRHDKPNEPTKEGLFSFVLFEFPFSSVSPVSRGHPSLVSLIKTISLRRDCWLFP
jgi:hypothetical protein